MGQKWLQLVNLARFGCSTSSFEVETMLKSLQLGKVTGPDAINNRMLKKLA